MTLKEFAETITELRRLRDWNAARGYHDVALILNDKVNALIRARDRGEV